MPHPPVARAAGHAAALILLAVIVTTPPALAADKGPVTFAQPRPDKALVYFARQARFTFTLGTAWVFADRTFLGVLDNGTYAYAFVDPGRHLIWTNLEGASREIDLAAGETVHLDVWQQIEVVSEARGRDLIRKAGDRAVPTPREIALAENHLRDEYDAVLRREARKAPWPAVHAPSFGGEGSLRIPPATAVILEIMETVTSRHSRTGSPVRFRLAEDFEVDGRRVIRAGAPADGVVRYSRRSDSFLGRSPILELTVPALTADDGTIVPLASPPVFVGHGPNLGEETLLLAVAHGLVVRGGDEDYYLAGARFRSKTREEAWVRPDPDPPARTAAPASADLVLRARAAGAVRFAPWESGVPDRIKILLDTDLPVTEVEVHAIGGLALPAPVPPREVKRTRKGWSCVFEGWGLVRHMRPGPGQIDLPIDLRGRLADGRTFTARKRVNYLIGSLPESSS